MHITNGYWFSIAVMGCLALAVSCGSDAEVAQPSASAGSAGAGVGGAGGADAGPDGDSGAAGAADLEQIEVVTGPSGFVTQYVDPVSGSVEVVSGGEGAPPSNVYVVRNRAELKAALANSASATFASDALAALLEPKLIYVEGAILGNELDDGSLATVDTYRTTPNPNQYDFATYLKYFDTAYKDMLTTQSAAGDMAAAAELALINAQPGTARTTFSNNQKSQIQFQVPPNTSLLGVGSDARIVDGYLSINTYSPSFGQTLNSNIIVRNLEFQVPQDYAPAWDPTDTSTGAWNARYDGISIVTGRNIWIDHCTFSDGQHLDNAEPTPFNGKHVQRHDGLIDIEDGSDDITLSYNRFLLHDKTTLIGSSGGGTQGQENYETGREHITFFANLWESSVQRDPLARWGQFHLFNNLYRGDLADPQYVLSYFIGMGTSSSIFSESNVFDVQGNGSLASLQGRVLSFSGGSELKDVGSWFNDAPFSELPGIASQKSGGKITGALGWSVPYAYVSGKTAAGVRNHVLVNAGAGKLEIQAP